jgi:hypothetical protein
LGNWNEDKPNLLPVSRCCSVIGRDCSRGDLPVPRVHVRPRSQLRKKMSELRRPQVAGFLERSISGVNFPNPVIHRLPRTANSMRLLQPGCDLQRRSPPTAFQSSHKLGPNFRAGNRADGSGWAVPFEQSVQSSGVEFIEPSLNGGTRAIEQSGQVFERVPALGRHERETQPFLLAPRSCSRPVPARAGHRRRAPICESSPVAPRLIPVVSASVPCRESRIYLPPEQVIPTIYQ